MRAAKVLAKFNKKAKEWLADLEKVEAKKIQLRPTEKSWSFAEMYDHVMKVARTYQIPNMKKSITESAKRKKRKNFYGYVVFNTSYRKNAHMKMDLSAPGKLIILEMVSMSSGVRYFEKSISVFCFFDPIEAF